MKCASLSPFLRIEPTKPQRYQNVYSERFEDDATSHHSMTVPNLLATTAIFQVEGATVRSWTCVITAIEIFLDKRL
jgi:hypothetical protein